MLAPLNAARASPPSLTHTNSPVICTHTHTQVHALRHAIEAGSKHRCSVIYGALPPEARSQQAGLFNRSRSGYSVLSASDAVGMGLNLAIRRVVSPGGAHVGGDVGHGGPSPHEPMHERLFKHA